MQSVAEASVVDVDELENDPLLSKLELPLQATFFPYGFPLQISTNSHEVITAAQTSWSHFRQKFNHPPLELRLGVANRGSSSNELPPPNILRMQWNLLLNIADANNFVVIDLRAGRSFGWVTQVTSESHLFLRYYLLDAAVLLMLSALRAAYLHAACVAPFGCGMLLCGDSEAGKSTLAYAGARAGWTFICDDGTHMPLEREDCFVVGDCRQIRFRAPSISFFPELEGRLVTPRANGKQSIEVPVAELPVARTADSALIQYLIFLNRKDPDVHELVPLPMQSILPWLKLSLIITSANSQTVEEDVLRRLSGVKILELRYQSLDWAVGRLQQLALTGK